MARATKQCSQCRETKDVTEFWRDRRNKDGRQNPCRDCRRVKRMDSYTGDTHANCGGELIHVDGTDHFVMRCASCRMAGIPV